MINEKERSGVRIDALRTKVDLRHTPDPETLNLILCECAHQLSRIANALELIAATQRGQ